MTKLTEDQKRELARLTPAITRIYDDRMPRLLSNGTTVMHDKKTGIFYDASNGNPIENVTGMNDYTTPRETSKK